MCGCELWHKLVELGADKLGSMLSELSSENYEASHYYKGGFQALKEAASSLFGIDSADFRMQCLDMIIIVDQRLDR